MNDFFTFANCYSKQNNVATKTNRSIKTLTPKCAEAGTTGCYAAKIGRNPDYLQEKLKNYSNPDWIVNQADTGRLLEFNMDEIKQTETSYRRREIYNNDKMVASLTMGFWTKLFSKKRYKRGGKSLLRIFPNKVKGKSQSDVYKDLTHIREFRNRIAHHEPICFDSYGKISTDFARKHYQLIRDYISYMGQHPDNVIQWTEKPDEVLDKIDKL